MGVYLHSGNLYWMPSKNNWMDIFSCFFWFSKEGFALLHIYKITLITLFLPSSLFRPAFSPTSLLEPCFAPCLLSWPACFLSPALATSITWALLLASQLPVSLVLLSVLCPLPLLQQSPKQGTVQVFKHRSHCSWPLTSGFFWVMCYPWSRFQKLFACFLQAFVPELCFADLTTVSVFIYKTHEQECFTNSIHIGVYGIGSFLCSILWHDLCGHCPVAFVFSTLLQVGNCAWFICLGLWFSSLLKRTLVCLLLTFNINNDFEGKWCIYNAKVLMYLCVMTEFVLVLTKLFFVCQMVFLF